MLNEKHVIPEEAQVSVETVQAPSESYSHHSFKISYDDPGVAFQVRKIRMLDKNCKLDDFVVVVQNPFIEGQRFRLDSEGYIQGDAYIISGSWLYLARVDGVTYDIEFRQQALQAHGDVLWSNRSVGQFFIDLNLVSLESTGLPNIRKLPVIEEEQPAWQQDLQAIKDDIARIKSPTYAPITYRKKRFNRVVERLETELLETIVIEAVRGNVKNIKALLVAHSALDQISDAMSETYTKSLEPMKSINPVWLDED